MGGEIVMSPGEKSDILAFIQKFPNKSVKDVAKEFGRAETTIRELIRRYKPTTTLARATLLAKASELVDTVLEKADVDQMIDLLQRPNMGVLEPVAAKGGAGGGGNNVGIMVSVTPAHLAAVDASTYGDGVHAEPAEIVESTDPAVLTTKMVKLGSRAVGEIALGATDRRSK